METNIKKLSTVLYACNAIIVSEVGWETEESLGLTDFKFSKISKLYLGTERGFVPKTTV